MTDLQDQRGDKEFLGDVLKGASPLRLLTWVMTQHTERAPYDGQRMWSTTDLSRTRGIGATRENLAAMNAQADSRRNMLEGSPAFHAAIDRIKAAGVIPEWGDDGEYSFTSRVLRLFVPAEAIPRLQEMAADDAGIHDPELRREAAELFRRWLLQNFHPDWKAYQERWPVVDRCPYHTELNDFGRDPNPIRP
jgi:hypothetical protein